MSSPSEEIELLERVLLRLGCADTDDRLEATVQRFLAPVILKVCSPHDNVRSKVVEVLTHIKRRVTSRPLVQIPVEALLLQYRQSLDSPAYKSFAIIFIIMGYPRLPLEQRSALAARLVTCEDKLDSYQEKLFTLLFPMLGEILLPDDPAKLNKVFDLDDKPAIRHKFLSLLQDVLLLPYGVTQEQEVPPGMSPYSFKRVISNNWKAEELEKIKKGIVRILCAGIFKDIEVFILLVIASADTRFSVATPAIAELSKVCTALDFSTPAVTEPLYTLFSGNNSNDPERKTTPCCARVRQKLLQYLIKCRGKGINTPKGIQVIFEGLYGANTNTKCKVLALQFGENFIKDGPPNIIQKVAKVILTGVSKVISKDSQEPPEVQNAAFSTIAQLARTCPTVVNQDLKIVLAYFTQLSSAATFLHSSIREALVAMAPAFAWTQPELQDNEEFDYADLKLTGQQHLLLAMLSDNAEAKVHIVQNVTSVFLTTCFPEYYPPARYLLLLIAGDRNSLHEAITTYLYGISKKDHINYNMLSSIEWQNKVAHDEIKLNEQKRIVLPAFKLMMNHVNDMAEKRLTKSMTSVVVGRIKLPYNLDTYAEILDYLRICLWYSAGIKSFPGDEKHVNKFKYYVTDNYQNIYSNEICQYVYFVQRSVEAKRTASNLLCLYDLLNTAPELFASDLVHLLEPLSHSLKDVSEAMRINVAQVYGIIMAYGFNDNEFDEKIKECLRTLPHTSLEHKHGWLLVLGHAFSRKIHEKVRSGEVIEFRAWTQFVEAIKVISKMLCDSHWLLVSAAVKCISMIGKNVEIPNIEVEIQIQNTEDDNEEMAEYKVATASTKLLIFGVIFGLVRSGSVRAKIREEAAKCLGCLAIGDGAHFTQRNLEKFLSLVKVQKDAALNIAISEAIVSTLNGYDTNMGPPTKDFTNLYCNDTVFEDFLNSLIRLVAEPNPYARQAISLWLLGVVKYCNHRSGVLKKRQVLQYAFTELLSDDSEFVQDVASRGLGLVYSLSDSDSQNDLANSLLDQLMGGKRQVNQVSEDTEIFAEGVLGKTPTGGNMTTYKELCSLASDLNQPDMIYQFMQLANHNATWNSKLGAAFGLKSLSADSKAKMKPFLGKIIPRLYRYKYDPTPKIQNSMISIWDSIVSDPNAIVEQYYWEILKEITDNLTFNEWRVRIACCLALRDLLKRPNGLRLRCSDRVGPGGNSPKKTNAMEIDEVPEPELKEIWFQLFRVMDDIHEGTRLAALGTAMFLSKLCVVAASSEHGKSGLAVASSILPLLLDTGVTHQVVEIRRVSVKTITDMIDSSGELIAPHLHTLIPCLLQATGELESVKLSYLSTRLAADSEAQEAVDTVRAEATKTYHTTDAIVKCVRFIDYPALEQMTPAVIELIKNNIILGTKIACAHFVCLVSIRLGAEMQPVVGKYLGACFIGLKDRNAIARKYYAAAIGHLVGNAKEQSIKNLLCKLDELYNENPANHAIPLTIQSINKRHHELLKDYYDNVLPLIFYAMHEEPNEENKSNIEYWKDLWSEVNSGDAGIRLNLHVIVPKLEKSFEDASWARKAQSANAIQTIGTRLSDTIPEDDRVRLINVLLVALQGRTFQGKERLLQALAALCKNLDKNHEICTRIIDAAMRECRKEEPLYRTSALAALGDILDQLDADRFEEAYNMIWYLIEKKDLRQVQGSDDEDNLGAKDLTADERNKRANILNKLKETVCETLGKAWPKNSKDTQNKFQLQVVERCAICVQNNTRQVQLSLMNALQKFVERLRILDKQPPSEATENREKKVKVDNEQSRNAIVEKICQSVLSAVAFAAGVPHTGLKKESLNIILTLLKRLTESQDKKAIGIVKNTFEDNLQKFQKDSSPEVRCRIKDIEEKISKIEVI